MAAQKGLDLILKVGDGEVSEAFTTVAGMRNVTLTLDKGTVDITSQDNTDRYRELLAGAAIKSVSISGDGVFKDAATDATMRTNWAADTIDNYQIVMPDFGTFEGGFVISSLEYAGAHDGEVTFSATLESSGEFAFTAA